MEKTKIENISNIKLDFFVSQNKKFVRIVLNPGETSWSDSGSSTKSMILYKRKNLIKTSDEVDIKEIEQEVVKKINPIAVEQLKKSVEEIPAIELQISPLDKAKKETEEYKQESEKKYKGKKRGRKKKRGPKPGSKKNKGGINPIEGPESK